MTVSPSNLDEIMTPAGAALASDTGLNALVAEPNGTVSLRGVPLLLAPKEQSVLHLLLRSWPQAVSKDDFADQIWHTQNMSDASLARCVAKLRQRIPARAGITIHAVYGWGYRLAEAPCEQASTSASESVGHPRLMLAAMAAPRHVEALVQANQWIQQRTASSLWRAQNLLRTLLTEAPTYAAAQLAYAKCLCTTVTCGFSVPRVQLQASLAQLQQLTQREDLLPFLQADMAHLLDCLWHFDEARALHAAALRTNPNDVETHGYWGWHLLATGQPAAAAQALQQAARMNPVSLDLHLLASRAFNAAGDHATSLAYCCQATELHPDNMTAQLLLLATRAYIQPAPVWAEAARALQSASTGWAFADSTLAYVFARCGDPLAAHELIAASRGQPASERINFLATLHLLGQAARAMDDLQEAARSGCGHLPLLLNLVEHRVLHAQRGMDTVLSTISKVGLQPSTL